MDIRSDRQKGLSYVELGKKYHMDPRTAKRYADPSSRPEYTLTGPKPAKLDPYKQKIDQMLERSAVFGAADPGEDAGNGIRRRLQHREGVRAGEENGLGRESNSAV